MLKEIISIEEQKRSRDPTWNMDWWKVCKDQLANKRRALTSAKTYLFCSFEKEIEDLKRKHRLRREERVRQEQRERV